MSKEVTYSEFVDERLYLSFHVLPPFNAYANNKTFAEDIELGRRIREWFETQTKGRYLLTGSRIAFELKSDAVHYRLAFG